jgi:hypothetical protein
MLSWLFTQEGLEISQMDRQALAAMQEPAAGNEKKISHVKIPFPLAEPNIPYNRIIYLYNVSRLDAIFGSCGSGNNLIGPNFAMTRIGSPMP